MALGEYLQKERANFARFYFLADEDLLEILGNAKDINRINPHLKKMFPAINCLILSESDNSIVGISSKEGEQLFFSRPVETQSRIYEWLSSVEIETKNCLKVHLVKACTSRVAEYLTTTLAVSEDSIRDWIIESPAQILILAAQIKWTVGVETALNASAPLKNLEENISQFIANLASLVVKKLDILTRKKAESLITELVHQRDVIRSLLDSKAAASSDFAWLSQLRVYHIDQEVNVSMANSNFSYGFEYLGIQDRLVQTPLTDRCYLTMTQALYNKLGGSPFGPAGKYH
jgi:dynein heavy chain 1